MANITYPYDPDSPLGRAIANRDAEAQRWINVMSWKDAGVAQKVNDFIRLGWFAEEMSTRLVQAQEVVKELLVETL